MKKSELRSLLKIITEEVIAAKQEQMNETKGLSGMKKAPESTEHTEKVADSKDLTGPAPKEKEEGKKLPVVKKPANPQKVGNVNESTDVGVATTVIGIVFMLCTAISALYIFIAGKFNDGKFPFPFNMLPQAKKAELDSEKIKQLEQKLTSKEGVLPLSIESLKGIAETLHKNKSGKSNFYSFMDDMKAEIVKALRKEGNPQLADQVENMSIGTAGTAKIVNAVLDLFFKKLQATRPIRPTQTADKPRADNEPSAEVSPNPVGPTGSTLKTEILKMIREEIDEMARTAGAVDPQYRKKIDGKWVIMGHPNQAKYPDGTPTTEPKGPYVKKEKNVNMGGIPTRIPPSSVTSTRSRETELAVADILKHDPEATDQEIAEELASRSDNGEPLNLAPVVIANAISIAKDGEDKTDDADEPAATVIAAKEKSDKQRKIANLRAYLMRKRGIKPTE